MRALIELPEYPQQAEANVRIILHIYWEHYESLDSIFILSNDTDVLVLILCYVFYFWSIGLKHLFIRMGNANNMISLQQPCNSLRRTKMCQYTENTYCDWL